MKEECIIITWMAKDQPGFLDFAYRIQSLAKIYRTTLVSPYPLTQPELAIPGVEHCVLPYDEKRAGWIFYMLACARLIRARKPGCAVLLHSLMAPLVWLTGRTPTALYWNEHPSRFTASPPGHPVLKRWARNLALKWFFMNAAKRADLVMPIGEAHYADLIHIGCRPSRVQLIYMGVDSSFLQSPPVSVAKQPDAPLELVYNGTVNQLRGRDVMLEAVALANCEQQVARLTLVGASEEEIDYCNDYANRLGIADAVTIRGRIPGHEIPQVLKQADFGLCFMEDLPWWRFNPPTKLFEYLVAGVPVMASEIRTHTQYISNWYNGVICQYDSRSLAETILQGWQRRAALPVLKDGARKSGEQYIWDRIEPEFLQAIKSIAQRSSQAAGHAAGSSALGMKRPVPLDSAPGEQ